MIRLFVFYLFSLNVSSIHAQDSLTLSVDEFLSIVKAYHPVMKQYQNTMAIAKANVNSARGGFDPNLDAKTGRKNIDGIHYYDQQEVNLQIPTWFGIDFNAGYDRIEGQKINTSQTKGELLHIGLTVPLAKNLLFDKRRAALVQAKLYEKMTQQELILAINEFLLQAENLYWHWVMQYRILKIQKEVLSRNQDRFEFTKKQYEFGEKPAIDTTEIYSQMIFFEMQINESSLDFQNLSLEIKQYLWLDNLVPYDFSNVLIPRDTLNLKDSIDYNFFYDALLNSSESFAALTYYKRKGELLEAERKAKFQDILPKLDFEYQIYNRRLNEMPFLPVFHSNFQYGLKFEYPLFARAASNQLKITKLKMVQNQLDYRIKENELQVKVNTLKNDLDNLIVQIQSMQTNISNYKKLLKAEENRLEFGESSFFLINSRETKLYEALEKLVKLQTKYRQNYNKFKWLYESLNK